MDLIIIFFVILAISIIATNTGGGGLMSIPFLIFMGLPPDVAIASNRVGAYPSGITGLIGFHKYKQVKWRLCLTMIIPAATGSFVGAWSVLQFSDDTLRIIISFIILISVPMLFIKDFGLHEFQATRNRIILGHILAFGGGYLSGLFAATGVWFTIIYIYMGLTFLQSAGTRKVTAIAMSTISGIVFILAGIVDWHVIIVMAVASALGGWIGAELGMKAGNVWIKRVFAIVIIASAVKLLMS